MEEIKGALKILIDLAEKTDTDFEDGKINIAEGIGLALSVLGLVNVVKSIGQLKAEFIDLTNDQRDEITRWFKNELHLRGKNTEIIIEEAFSSLMRVSESMNLFKKSV